MSFLTDTAAGAGAGAGFTGAEASTGAGFSGVAEVGGQATAAGAGTAGQTGLVTQLGNYLKDPEVQKALGDVLKHYGNMSSAAEGLPPQAAQIVQQAIKSGGKMTPPTNPYMGDVAQYLTPELAQHTMRALGIPFGGGGSY